MESLKLRANEHFNAQQFIEAEVLYSQALTLTTAEDVKKVLYTNRAAARIALCQYTDAIQDALEAIAIDKTYLKAYFRAATAYEALNQLKKAYLVWCRAKANCPLNETTEKHHRKTQASYKKIMRQSNMESVEEFLESFKLMTDKR